MATKSDVQQTLGAPRKRKGRSGCVIAVLVVLLLVVAGIAFLFLRPEPPVQFETAEVTRGELTVFVTATGELSPTVSVDVGAEVSGLIEEVFVDFNDPVTEGQLLARLDVEQLQAQVTQSEAQLAQAEAGVLEAEATVAEARTDRERFAALAQRDTASRQRFEQADAALKRAQARVRSAEAQVRNAAAQLELNQSRLDRAEIRSPIDGIVLDRLIEAGQTVASSFQTPQLFTIAGDLTQMELKVDIDEADIGRVAAGQRAQFTVDAYDDRRFEGAIVSVRNAPQEAAGVVTYEAVLEVDNPDLALKPGMTATADIVVETVDDALLVPNGALRFTPPSQREQIAAANADLPRGTRIYRVWMDRPDGPEAVELEIGVTNGRQTVVTGGALSEGDALLIDVKTPRRGG